MPTTRAQQKALQERHNQQPVLTPHQAAQILLSLSLVLIVKRT